MATFKGLGMALYWTLGAVFFLSLGTSACNQDETPSLPQSQCGEAFGGVEWMATKNETAFVTGRQDLTGQVTQTATEITLSLTFNPRPRTGVELRDERLQALVFGPEAFTFQGRAATKMPGAGETLPVTVKGTLSLAGVLTPLEVPAEVDWLSTGVLAARGSFDLSLAELGLSPRVEALMSLVDARVEDTVKAHFDIEVKEPCP